MAATFKLNSLSRAITGLFFVGVAGASLAQTSTPQLQLDSGQLLNQNNQSLPKPGAVTGAGKVTLDTTVPAPVRKMNVDNVPRGFKIDVTNYSVIGFDLPESIDKMALFQKYVGTGKTFDDVEAAADALQVALRQSGYFLAQVDIPPQKLEAGLVRLRVFPGVLDKVEVAPLPADFPVERSQIDSVLAGLKPGEVLTVASIERILFLLQDLRGINVTSLVAPGSAVGSAKLVVTLTAGAQSETTVDADNYGSRYTGPMRVGVGYGVNSLAHRGDLLKINVTESTGGGTLFGRIAYQIPVGGSGLKLGAAFSALRYRLGTASFAPLQASGEGYVQSFFALYPVVRSRNANVFFQASYDSREFVDRQLSIGADNRKSSKVRALGIVGDTRDQRLGGGINNFSLALSSGKVNLETPTQLLADQAATGRQTNGQFLKATYGVGRQQLLWNAVGNANDRLVLYASLQGQMAIANLDSSEKFSAGGPAGVRAYAGGEATGDSGAVATWELRKNIVSEAVTGDLVLSIFGDYGYARFNRNPLATDTSNTANLSGHGLGLAWSMPDNFLLKTSIAWRTKYTPVADPQTRGATFYLSLNKYL